MSIHSLVNLWDFETSNFELHFKLNSVKSSGINHEGFSFFYYLQEEMYSSFFDLDSHLIIKNDQIVLFEIKNKIVQANEISKNSSYENLSVSIIIPFQEKNKYETFKYTMQIAFNCFFFTVANGESVHVAFDDQYRKYEINEQNPIDIIFNKIYEQKQGISCNQKIFPILSKYFQNNIKKIFYDWKHL